MFHRRVFILLTLVSLSKFDSVSSFEIKCEYITFYRHPTNGYNCKVQNQVETNDRNMSITKVIGQHRIPQITNNNVDRLFYFDNSEMKFIPKGYTKHFPNLINLWIAIAPIENIYQDDFEEENVIEIFAMRSTKITRLPADIFQNLHHLQELYLYGNKLKIIDENAFRASTKLTLVHLYDNSIEYLPHIFRYNPLMKEFDIRNNKLKIIDADLISGMLNLVKIDLRSNFCINMNYPPTLISVFIEKLKDNCENPFDEITRKLKEEKESLKAQNERLKIDYDGQEEALKNAINEKEKLQEDLREKILEYEEEADLMKTHMDMMTNKISILKHNHSEIMPQIDAITKENENLKLNISLSKSIKDLNEKELIDLKQQLKTSEKNYLELIKNLTALEYENIQAKNNLSHLNELYEKILIDKRVLETDFLNISLENEELRGNLGNITINDAQMNIAINELESKKTTLIVLIVILIIAFVSLVGKFAYDHVNTRKRRAKTSSGYELSFSIDR